MARPSLKAEKKEQILAAYERCIARHGVDGATLQKVAEEAGMARPLLRHYVGNQAELLQESLARYLARQQEELAWFESVSTPAVLVGGLFAAGNLTEELATDVLIASAFVLAAPQHPELQEAMAEWNRAVNAAFTATLARLFPAASAEQVEPVATGLIGIYFNLYSMWAIDSSTEFLHRSQRAAEVLLARLTND